MKYLIGNLKMNLTCLESMEYIKKLQNAIAAKKYQNVKFGAAFSHDAISLSYTNLDRNFLFGAQNIFHEEKGAYTGEISIRSAIELGLDFILIGHSERRKLFNETDELINAKIKKIEKTKIFPILCVGENQEEFENNKMEEVLTRQIQSALKDIDILGRLIISYEPVYCIGNGIIPKHEHVQHAVDLIRKLTNNKVPVLYGGSVCDKNIDTLLEVKNVDGFLVGGAALDPEKFVEMGEHLERKK
ncbi:triose-phosphate isomerase [Metamycoplasma neophronis]|uniref:Triosephosphate isomerase n=1 Tax=Metamycoplasma neophronis TaxID=872983 RepID=A0ABY2YZ78_9BACT|nr:triose-phosphate isomerase family protein [Metamycoplasma neophronis]TPR53265.1 triosephosphate isomerase [Metamycoplasma neophronis]